MNYLFLIVVGLAGVWLGRRLALKRCRFIVEQEDKKSQNKEKILNFLTKRRLLSGVAEISNAEIAEYLGVSSRTVVNYMDELERGEKVEQVGDTGRGVYYKLK